MARVSVSVARIYFHAGFRYLPMGNLLGVAFPNPLDLRWIANRRVTHRVTNNLQQLTATVCEAPFRFSMICQIWRNLVPVVLCRRRTRAPVTGPHVGVLRSTSASRCISVHLGCAIRMTTRWWLNNDLFGLIIIDDHHRSNGSDGT